jgi:ABC-type branched-subunit amino acid transport system ATPase component
MTAAKQGNVKGSVPDFSRTVAARPDRVVGDTRRIVELGCLVAVDAGVLCLDEPTAGGAQHAGST